MKKSKTIRIKPDAHKKLRMLAARHELSLIDTIDKALDALSTQNRIKTKR